MPQSKGICAATSFNRYIADRYSTSPPQSHLGRERRYTSWQIMHFPAACASRTMCYVTERLLNVSEALRSVTERYGTLWNVMEALWNVTEHCGGVMEPLQSVTEH